MNPNAFGFLKIFLCIRPFFKELIPETLPCCCWKKVCSLPQGSRESSCCCEIIFLPVVPHKPPVGFHQVFDLLWEKAFPPLSPSHYTLMSSLLQLSSTNTFAKIVFSVKIIFSLKTWIFQWMALSYSYYINCLGFCRKLMGFGHIYSIFNRKYIWRSLKSKRNIF